MKLLYYLLLISIFSKSFFSQGFNSIHTKDGIHIIAVGKNGSIFMSYDGGATFGAYSAGSVDHNGVFAISNKIFICSNNGLIFYSTDFGNNWNASNAGSNNLNSIWFTDANTGYVIGNTGVIYKTTNGAANWTLQTSGTSQNLNAIKFTSSTTGYVCGNNGVVLYTTNGGSNWIPLATGTSQNLLSLDASGSVIVATGSDGMIFRYSGSWTAIDYKIVSKSEIRGVSMINSNTFYTCGGGGFITMTTDGGFTRTHQMNPMLAPLKAIYFYDANRGWAVASTNNAILRTTNGGTNWIFQTGVTMNLTWAQPTGGNGSGNIGNGFCINPKNKNTIFIMMGNTVKVSYNRGQTWQTVGTNPPSPWTASCHSFFVNAIDTNIWIAAKGSSGGYIIKTTNYGANWYSVLGPINITSYGMPLEDDPNDPNRVYLGPDNAALRVSTNYGETWTNLSGGETGGIFRSPCDIVIQYENPNIIFVGDGVTGSGSAKFWKSTNAGMNWTLINTVTGSEIPMIGNTAQDLNLVYHSTWSSGGFWKSTNMGSNFSNIPESGSLWSTDIAKDEPHSVAHVPYSGGTCRLSTDGGATFSSSSIGSSTAAGLLYYDKATLFAQQSGGVYRMTANYTVSPVVNVKGNSGEIPSSFALSQNYPNPFNPSTSIKFDVSYLSFITLKVYDITGREVKTIISDIMNPGKYNVTFDASELPSGIYLYSLRADGITISTKKMILIK